MHGLLLATVWLTHAWSLLPLPFPQKNEDIGVMFAAATLNAFIIAALCEELFKYICITRVVSTLEICMGVPAIHDNMMIAWVVPKCCQKLDSLGLLASSGRVGPYFAPHWQVPERRSENCWYRHPDRAYGTILCGCAAGNNFIASMYCNIILCNVCSPIG